MIEFLTSRLRKLIAVYWQPISSHKDHEAFVYQAAYVCIGIRSRRYCRSSVSHARRLMLIRTRLILPTLKRMSKGIRFKWDDRAKRATMPSIKNRPAEFFDDGMKGLVAHWQKYIKVILSDDYIKKYIRYFVMNRIFIFLLFISIIAFVLELQASVRYLSYPRSFIVRFKLWKYVSIAFTVASPIP